MILTKEWLLKTISELEEERDATPGAVNEDAAMALAAMKRALASLTAEPVCYLNRFTGRTFTLEQQPGADKDMDVYVPLYTAPPAPVSMKDHQIRELVNELRDIAVEYHGTQQLRERIARTVRAAMLQDAAGNCPAIPEGWVACSERMPEEDGNYWGWWSESKRQGPVWFIKSDLQAQFQSSEITHWMPLPAAPQQEVKSG